MKASARQIGHIHALAKQKGLDEETRRALMERETGKRSTKLLLAHEADKVIDALKGSTGTATRALTGRYAKVLQALWLTAWNCGLVRNRDDKALIAFVERQTGLSHPRFLLDAADARKAIEGLKRWIARDAGVVWPKAEAPARERKIAVLEAQYRIRARLYEAIGAAAPPHKEASLFSDIELDQIQARLGSTIRAMKAKQALMGE